jgi:hypothetical protein
VAQLSSFLAYLKHTAVAEKFPAIYLLELANTRIKHDFDLYRLLADRAHERSKVRSAIKRITPAPANTTPALWAHCFVTDGFGLGPTDG